MQLLDSYKKSLWPVLLTLTILVLVEFFVWLIPLLHPETGIVGYVPLHTILETAAIVVSFMVFAIGWNVPVENRSSRSVFLACIFFGVGSLDLLHTLSYQGMPDFITPNNPEKSIYFWLQARLLLAVGLLALCWLPWRQNLSNRQRWVMLLSVLVLVSFSALIGFKHLDLLPHTFISGQGLTAFKIGTEYLIMALCLVSAVKLLTQMRKQQDYDVVGFFGAVCVMALSELFFTFYASVTDVFNLLGHIYKVIAYGFFYKSVFLSNIKCPYQQLNQSRNVLQIVIDNLPLRVFWKDRDSRYLGCNTAFARDAGKTSPKDVIGKLDTQLAWREQAGLYREDDLQVINSNASKLNFEEPQTTPEGKRIWLRTSKVPLMGPEMDTIGVLGVYDDISDRKRLEEDLHMAYSAIENSKVAHFWVNSEGQVTYANDFACNSLGYARDELVGMHVWDFDPDYPPSAQPQFWTNVKRDGIFAIESRHKRKDGTIFPVEVTSNYISSEDSEQVFCVVHDITKRKQAEEMSWFHANFDYLTGLPNRRMLQDRLEQEIKKAHRTGLPLALLFLDLDNFKEINDTLGHAKGDMLLHETATRLTSCVRESDTVARLGGDEFTIVLGDLRDPDDVTRVAMMILQKIAEPFNLDGEVVYMTASIGVTCYPDDGTDIEILLKNADQAMYAAKAAGRNAYSYFTPSMQAVAQSRMRLANDLRVAIKNDQLWIAYQPIVDLKSNKVVKAEALVRWQHPQLGMVSPAEFIPVAEHTGLINSIGEFVFHEAALRVGEWQRLYDKEFQVSVNVSPVQFNDNSGKYKPWYQQLKRLGLNGKSVVVEITEGLLLEANTKIKDKLLEFRDAGIQVAIDDFGTGYSSLSYLRKFDIDYIKIDQSFVRGMTTNAGDVALCEAMIVMAHKLDMTVIAEGVETVEQLDLLASIGCDFGQGYLFSKPLSVAEFEKLLQKA